ncbi:MAG: TetR/AcrR family transcriptional regulator [Clostridia bacterium]|nr:TetR/AcrR family transcriptional regulator [Clostridia bacterium]
MRETTARKQQANATRQKILQAARELIQEKGFDQLKMTDVAKRAGVSVGSLYNHYRSKDALFFAGYDNFDRMILEKQDSLMFENHIEALRSVIYAQCVGAFMRGTNYIANVLRYQLFSHDSAFTNKERAFPTYVEKQLSEAIRAGELIPGCDGVPLTAGILRVARGCIFDCAVRNTPESIGENIIHDMDAMLAPYLSESSNGQHSVDPAWLNTYRARLDEENAMELGRE